MKLKIENIVYDVPKSWDEITVEQFMKIETLTKLEDDLEMKSGVVKLLCKIPDNIMPLCSCADINHVFSNLNFIEQTEPSIDITHTFFIDGKEFYFDSNFQKSMNNDMFRDGLTLLKEPLTNLDKILAMFLRPVIKRSYSYSKFKGFKKKNYLDRIITLPYSGDLVEQNAPLMLQLSINKVWGIACFFFLLSEVLRQQAMAQLSFHLPPPEQQPTAN